MQGLQILFLLIVVVGIGIAFWASARRRKELAAWAHANGFTFSPAKDHSFDELYRSFGCLRRGHSRYAYNITEGERAGRRITAFDYHYATGSGKNRHDYRFSAILMTSAIRLHPLRIRPEGFFDKVGEFFGFDDIDFESADFSNAFHVRSDDKRWAYDVLHQGSMEFLLSMPRFSIEFDRDRVIVWRNRRFDPSTFEAAMSIAEGLLDRLPDYVIRDRQESRGGRS